MSRKQYERQVYGGRAYRHLATVYDTSMPENVFDDTDGRWAVVCEEHGTILNVRTMRRAFEAAEDRDFCEGEPHRGE